MQQTPTLIVLREWTRAAREPARRRGWADDSCVSGLGALTFLTGVSCAQANEVVEAFGTDPDTFLPACDNQVTVLDSLWWCYASDYPTFVYSDTNADRAFHLQWGQS